MVYIILWQHSYESEKAGKEVVTHYYKCFPRVVWGDRKTRMSYGVTGLHDGQ